WITPRDDTGPGSVSGPSLVGLGMVRLGPCTGPKWEARMTLLPGPYWVTGWLPTLSLTLVRRPNPWATLRARSPAPPRLALLAVGLWVCSASTLSIRLRLPS